MWLKPKLTSHAFKKIWFIDDDDLWIIRALCLQRRQGTAEKKAQHSIAERVEQPDLFPTCCPFWFWESVKCIVALNSNRNIAQEHFVIGSKKVVYWSNLSLLLGKPDLFKSGIVVSWLISTKKTEWTGNEIITLGAIASGPIDGVIDGIAGHWLIKRMQILIKKT